MHMCLESRSGLIACRVYRQFVGLIDQLTEILMSSCCLCLRCCLMEGLANSCSSSWKCARPVIPKHQAVRVCAKHLWTLGNYRGDFRLSNLVTIHMLKQCLWRMVFAVNHAVFISRCSFAVLWTCPIVFHFGNAAELSLSLLCFLVPPLWSVFPCPPCTIFCTLFYVPRVQTRQSHPPRCTQVTSCKDFSASQSKE